MPASDNNSDYARPVSPKVEAFINKHFRSFFADANGQIVIGQPPNLPLKLWFATQAGAILTMFWLKPVHPFFVASALLSICWWAIWEVVDGVSPWRRTLGLIGYTIALLTALHIYL